MFPNLNAICSSLFFYKTEFSICQSHCVRDLGVLVDGKLTWDNHIFKLCKIGKQLSWWILSVFYTRDSSVMLTVFNSIVRSKLEYCSQIWDPYLIRHIDALEQVQRVFTKRIKFLYDLNYWERIKKLKIMSLQRRREKLTILLMWKIKHNMVPNDINLEFLNSDRKSGNRAVVKPMPKITGKMLTMYEISFIIKAPKLLNNLRHKLTEIDDLTKFKGELNRYLKLVPDQPPIRGYYHNNKNSLLDYRPHTVQF